jgi:hypothetical protein
MNTVSEPSWKRSILSHTVPEAKVLALAQHHLDFHFHVNEKSEKWLHFLHSRTEIVRYRYILYGTVPYV